MGVDRHYRKVAGPSAKFKDTIIVLKQSLSAAATAVSVANPLGSDLIVTNAILDLTANAASTPVTADIGCDAADGNTSDDTLMDEISVGTPVGAVVYNSADNGGSNGALARKWESDKYLTMVLTGTPTGIAGNLYIYYRKA